MKPFSSASGAVALVALIGAGCAPITDPEPLADEDVASLSPSFDYVTDDVLRLRGEEAGLSAEALEDLATVRRATAPFHRVDVAEASGWPRDFTGCLDFPDGYMGFGPGAMGHHWISPAAYNDGGVLDVSTPEALLYERRADGSVRLTAVEYIIPERDLPPTAPPPVLFGREMMFHPDFRVWGMHVWLWLDNPYGLFADVNPQVGCEYSAQP